MGYENPNIILIDGYGNQLPVQSGSPIPSLTPTLVLGGSDGTNARYMLVDSSGRPVLVGAGTAGTPTGGVISIQGVSGGTAIPVSGTITATIGSTSATGAATPSSASLAGGAVTTAAPTYTTGNLGALSLTTSGLLRVDASGTTITITGSITGTATDNTTNVTTKLPVMAAVANTAAPTWTNGNMVPLSVDTSGALRITGTISATNPSVSTTGAAPPASATYIGGSVTTAAPTYTTGQMSALSLTTAGALRTQDSSAVTQASTTSGQTGQLMQGAVTTAAPTYTTGQTNPISLTTAGAIRVDGSATTQPVSGTVTAAQATAANLNATVVQATAANLRSQTASESTTATATGTVASLTGGAVTTAAPTYTTGQMNALSLTTAGALRTDSSGTTQPVSGTVTATQATAANLRSQTSSESNTAAAVPTQASMVGGSDGTNLRAIKVATDGTVQTLSREIATFTALATGIALANNKSMFSIQNTTGSTVKVKIHEIYMVNVQTTGVTGVVTTFELRRATSHAAGTAITTIETMETTDSLNASVTVRTNATITGESTTLLWRSLWSSDEWGPGGADTESTDHTSQTMFPVYNRKTPNTKPITLNANESLTIKCATNTTAGTFDLLVVFTQE